MPTIACSAPLLLAIGEGGPLKRGGASRDSVRLGDWAAILAGRKLVVAIEKRTCLTLVLPLRPMAGLRNRFVAALRHALLACGVSPRTVPEERRVRA